MTGYNKDEILFDLSYYHKTDMKIIIEEYEVKE